MKQIISCLIQSSCLLFSSSLTSMPVKAQVASDATTSTQVSTSDNINFQIDGGKSTGSNLFHSFREFSVPSNGSASFNNTVAIENIFSRVTGGNISNIDGLIRANGNANLFLINPNGIIFGENARLDIGGSFLGSTADSLLFPNTEFKATDLENLPVLTINAPIGLGFRDNPAPIINRSFAFTPGFTEFPGLRVQPGTDLTLVGGDIIFDGGSATAPGGSVNLGGLSAAGTVSINQNGSLLFPRDVVRANVTFTNSASVNGSSLFSGNVGISFIETSASITVNARNIDISENSFLLAEAGNIILNATDSISISQGSDIVILVDAVGNSGGIDINTTNLFLLEGGGLFVSTFGQGDTGEITINASEAISIDGESQDGFSSGIFSIFESTAVGNVGDININTSSLFVTNNAEISAQTKGKGNAGNLQINAAESVEVSGLGSGLFSRTSGTGNAGSVTITTPQLRIRNNGQVGVNNFIETDLQIEPLTDELGNPILDRFGDPLTTVALIFNPSEGSGNTGVLEITTDSLQLEDGGSIAALSAGGDGGNIKLMVDDLLILRRNSSISSTAGLQGTGGDGGNIDIEAKFILAFPNENSDITANAFNGAGGKIDITAKGVFGLEERSSTPSNNTNDIDASSKFGVDGTVVIKTPNVSALKEVIEAPEIVELQTLGINTCSGGGVTGASSFNLTGKGGVPPQLTAPLSSDAIVIEGKSASIRREQTEVEKQEKIQPLITAQGKIYPAKGIEFKENGDIVLTAYPTGNIQRTPYNSPNCNKS